ncbi:hypothetical protein Cgig2_025385 [Carnegiea gigantea]|uniref:Uncharacterized protein n=1 Tax=Carnegiea gigantea TaxID=171969 RepID=A0A9Q1GQF2_9CARY|nr:hypothetical protein Cgig2_025385 [Carnegiea gigantea]
MSPSGFVAMIENLNEAQRQAVHDMGFGGFLHLQAIELPGDLCKWLVDNFDLCSVTLYISADKKIEITLMNVHLTLALPIGGRKVEEFYGKKPKDAKSNEVLSAWRKEWNLQDETPKLSQMPLWCSKTYVDRGAVTSQWWLDETSSPPKNYCKKDHSCRSRAKCNPMEG